MPDIDICNPDDNEAAELKLCGLAPIPLTINECRVIALGVHEDHDRKSTMTKITSTSPAVVTPDIHLPFELVEPDASVTTDLLEPRLQSALGRTMVIRPSIQQLAHRHDSASPSATQLLEHRPQLGVSDEAHRPRTVERPFQPAGIDDSRKIEQGARRCRELHPIEHSQMMRLQFPRLVNRYREIMVEASTSKPSDLDGLSEESSDTPETCRAPVRDCAAVLKRCRYRPPLRRVWRTRQHQHSRMH